MSTQFDIAASSTSTAAVAGSSTGASCGANATAAAAAAAATAAGWPSEHLHHHQPHIAVHTPVHALRGSSSESQPSFSAYSSGSPQAGFHVPANAYSAITSPSCASASPYARKARYSDSDANGATDITVKLENGSSARLLDAFGASAPISMSHLNAIDCLPYYESKQQQHDQQKQQNKEESVPLPCISEASRSMDTVEDKFHSIFDYDNIDGNAELDATRQQQQVENGDPKSVNNNNNSNFVVDNNGSANNNNSDNNSNGNGSGQFYSLGKSGNRTFFRAPGLEAPDLAAMASAGGGIHVCPVCSFSCKSTFHYNSHMNTHGDHQCTMCNYTSRTEGRLRKHMRESHTHAERVKAGLEDGASENSASPGATATTIASLVNMVNMSTASAVVPLPASATANSATHDLLALSDMKSNFTATYADPFSLASDSLATKVIPGALDQIKALTERANNSMTALNEILGISSAGSHNDNNMHHDGVGPRDPTDDDDEMEAESSQAGPSLGQPTNGAAAVASQPPARRSGRPKIYRCKQCPHISTTKEQSWAHNRTHIPSDKQLNCKQCGFVTEYKHHLEYHMRNHKGSKPFKCTKCSYTCVNKSMLNSHMKSHTPVYQYRCKDCAYQTKYCHSLKMHLEKYRHTRMPGTVEIDSDGEEKPISEGDPDDYGHMDINESRNGEDSRHTDSVMADDQQQQQQQSSRQQQRQQQSLNSMLLQPIAPSAANLQQYSDQIQQYSSLRQLEQMNELLRAANPTNTFACQQCDYVTASNEELLRHNVAHLLVNQQQQHQQQQQTPSLTSLYHNLAAVQQQHQQQQQSDQQQQKLFSQQQQQALSNALGSSGSELLNGILQPDSGTKELAAQLQQELLRAQVVAQQQQQQQQQQEEESRRQAVVAAMASLANGNLGNGALTSALLGHVTSVTSSTGGVTSTDAHGAIFAPAGLADAMAADSGVVDPSTAASATVANHFHSSNTTTASGFGNDDDELQLAHSLSPMCSSGRRGSVGSASTSGGECTSKTCSVSPGSEGHGGSRKRKPSKTLKVEQISAKLRDGADEPKGHRSREHDAGESRNKSNGTVAKSNLSECGALRARSNTNGSGDDSNFSTLFTQIERQNRMPHACQHCMIAFRDKALYQIHLGYHGYDTPFKCNRCGHVSDSPLEFNLHLYQAKHD